MPSKRANGEGTLYHRPDGRWQCSILNGYQVNGKRKYKTFYGKNQTEVRKKRDEYLKKLDAGLVLDQEYLFSDWASVWYESHKENIMPTTQEGYKYTIRILNGGLGKRRIGDIKAFDIERFLSQLRNQGKSDSSIAKCRGMLYQIFNKAEANDLIQKNPVRFAEKMRSGMKREKDAFSLAEVKHLMKYLPEDKIGWSIRLMLGTGMRTQELLALEPRHINGDGSEIVIEQAVVMIKGRSEIGPPKSKDSYRRIPVPENVRCYARLLAETDKKFIWEAGRPNKPCNPSYFRKLFRAALEFAGDVRILSPHCCRHTYVSQMQALGVDIATIQSIVGHADMDMTMHYLHVQSSIREDAIHRFEVAFQDI